MANPLPIPAIENRHEFNLERWNEVSADPLLASIDYRIETDSHGHIVMTPPPDFQHGDRQFTIGHRLRILLPEGKVVTECPISTNAGVKAADVAWISDARLQESLRGKVLVIAPEICVEVLSPSNTRQEIDEKKRLYFEGGAEEVWICDLQGRMLIFRNVTPNESLESKRCPGFPALV
jgi:Uma2 family endonuclease